MGESIRRGEELSSHFSMRWDPKDDTASVLKTEQLLRKESEGSHSFIERIKAESVSL